MLDVDYAGQQRLRAGLPAAARRRLGRRGRRGLRRGGPLRGRAGLGRSRVASSCAGSSAGGFTVLCALAFHDVFAAGASYYGIGDLEALRRETHKFESHYDQSLIGPYPERRDLYVARSPLHAADRIRRPVIFFQGLDDRVVPPGQAEAMAAALRARGMRRRARDVRRRGARLPARRDASSRALEAELAFYRDVLGLPGRKSLRHRRLLWCNPAAARGGPPHAQPVRDRS